MAETPRKRAPRKAAAPKPLQLATEPCPTLCENGEVPEFDPATGGWGRGVCGRCMGAGVIERQYG